MTPFDYLTILHGDAAPAQDNADNIVVSFKRGGGKPFDNRAFALSDLGAAARLIDEQSASDADAYAALVSTAVDAGRKTPSVVVSGSGLTGMTSRASAACPHRHSSLKRRRVAIRIFGN